MKSKTKKAEELGLLKDKLSAFEIVVFTSFSKMGEKGLSVAQMTELKKLLRSFGSEYFVIKKTLIDLAVKDKNYDGLDVYGMEGSVGLVLGGSDSYGVAKSVYNFSKKNPALYFWGALLRPPSTKDLEGKQYSEGQAQFINLDTFLEMAKMPSKEILLGRLVGMLTYPIRGLAVALSEVAKKREATS